MKRYWLVTVCAVICTAAAVYEVEQWRIGHIRKQAVADSLKSDWIAATFLIQFDNHGVEFVYDPRQPAQADFTEHVRRMFAIADEHGRVLQESVGYAHFGLPVPISAGNAPRIWESAGKADTKPSSGHYVLCTGPIRHPDGRMYQLTLGRLLD
jgi:hypothetical protein